MNVERLLAIASKVNDDIESTQLVKIVTDLSTALQNQVREPAQPSHQEAVSATRRRLDGAIAASAIPGFSPAWRQVVEELGIDDILGEPLLIRVEEVFTRNQITPSTASDEVAGLAKKLSDTKSNLASLVKTLGWFNFDRDSLQPGDSEIGLLVPREAVRNELAILAEEFDWLNRTLLPFAEMATGSRPPFRVRTISSSNFGAFVEAAVPIAACVAVGVERVVALYKNLLEIRRLHKEMKDTGVPAESLKGVEAHANEVMGKGITEIARELGDQFGQAINEGRRNELVIELRLSLNAIANRIDRGYNVEVRAEPPTGSTDEGESKQASSVHFAEIAERQAGLRFMNLTGQQILSLPETTTTG